MKITPFTIARNLSLGVFASLWCFAAQAQEVVEVFRLSNQSVVGTANTVYVVDALHNATERLSVELPNIPAEAQRIAEARLKALTEQDKEVLKQASTSVIRAAEYKIVKVPAIVFDGKGVIYGIADVEQARVMYRSWRARRGS